MSPSHTRRRGRIYRYYVAREAIANGYETCAVTSVPGADVEGAVLDHIKKLLAAPELVARTWASAKREGEDGITEREVTILLADLATVWGELFPAEQARIVQLLVERVDVQEDALESGVTERIETRLDGTTLIVRIPMRFQRRGGRKRIVTPDGTAIVPASKPQPDGTLVKALARAWRWQPMLDAGAYTSVSDIGDAENISKSYVSRILRLARLSPDIIEMILEGDRIRRYCWSGSSGRCRRTGRNSANIWDNELRRVAAGALAAFPTSTGAPPVALETPGWRRALSTICPKLT
jgi:hypothetical protein